MISRLRGPRHGPPGSAAHEHGGPRHGPPGSAAHEHGAPRHGPPNPPGLTAERESAKCPDILTAGGSGELPARGPAVSADPRGAPPRPEGRGRAHPLRARALRHVQGEPPHDPPGPRRARPGGAPLPPRRARHRLDAGRGRGRQAPAGASEARRAGVDALIAASGAAWGDVAQAVHGTTLGSNVVIERKARGVGLLTTRGFRDVLIIGREKRYQVYDLSIEKPAPLIPRRLIGEVSERILADGSVRTPLDEADARRAVRELVARGVTTLAVCLLHAYVNPAHERRLAAIVGEEAPRVTV